MTNGLTTVAGVPSGGGVGSAPKPERTEVKKPEPTVQEQVMETVRKTLEEFCGIPMADYFKEQQEACLEWPEIDGFEPWQYTERS